MEVTHPAYCGAAATRDQLRATSAALARQPAAVALLTGPTSGPLAGHCAWTVLLWCRGQLDRYACVSMCSCSTCSQSAVQVFHLEPRGSEGEAAVLERCEAINRELADYYTALADQVAASASAMQTTRVQLVLACCSAGPAEGNALSQAACERLLRKSAARAASNGYPSLLDVAIVCGR